MNIILIVSDTLRRDHLGCYGNEWVSTPNIDRLAKYSTVFDNAYTSSFPTIPHRTDLITGRFTFTYRDWAPLPKDEIVISQFLGESGYVTMLITDTPHLMKEGYNFERDYSGWVWIRGQENDKFMTDPIHVELPCPSYKLRGDGKSLIQHMRNTSLNKGEEDCFVAKTMTEACNWLDRNYKQEKFFLYIDTFDPHEPWDPPHYYVDMYDKNYKGDEMLFPVYGYCKGIYTKTELNHLRAHYAGEVTLVDRWTGKLFQKIDDLSLLNNTLVIFTSDHGFYIGEHGFTGKSFVMKEFQGLMPLYEEIAHIPLIMYFPKTKPARIKSFVQSPDIMPTILEYANLKKPSRVQGKSLIPALKNKNNSVRDITVSAPSIKYGPVAGQRCTITTKNWCLIYKGENVKPEGEFETKIVDGITRKQAGLDKKVGNELYNLSKDPTQKHNLFTTNRNIATKLHAKFVEFLKSVNTPEQYLKYWKKL